VNTPLTCTTCQKILPPGLRTQCRTFSHQKISPRDVTSRVLDIPPLLHLGARFPPLPFPHSFRAQNASCSSHDDSSFRSDSPHPSTRYVHPYANPDLLPPGPPPVMPLPRTPSNSRDQSSEERDRLISPLRRASESPLSSPGPLTLRKASESDLSLQVPPSRAVSDEDEDTENLPPFASLRARAFTSPMPSSLYDP